MASKKQRSKKAASKKAAKKSSARKAPARKAKSKAKAAPRRTSRGSAELDRVAGLLELMKEHGLVELEIGPDNLRLSKSAGVPVAAVAAPAPIAAAAAPVVADAAAGPAGEAAAPVDPDLETFPSPMVGTFFRAPSPEADPYVVEGDRVSANSTVCIIEAMKVFNEIKAETSGVIAEILVENGEAVEYGQPLFTLRKA